MNEIKINKREFDLAKKRLKEFSEKTEDELKISKVRTDGGFLGLGDHKVTGYELNDRLETIQKNFISVNTTNNKVIREFREVYNALETLDKYYIASIVANLEAIRKTSNDVRKQQDTLRKHNEELEEQQNRLNVHQADIKKEQENITIAVNALKAFRKKFEGLNIERISSDYAKIQAEIKAVLAGIKELSEKTAQDITSVNNKNKDLSDRVDRGVSTLFNEVEVAADNIKMLSDKTTKDITSANNKIKNLSEQVNKDVSNLL